MPSSPSFRFPPIYPVFIAVLSLSGPASPRTIAIAQAFLGALTCVMFLLLAIRILPFGWAFVVALIYALHPGAIASASAILSETVFTALLVSAILMLSTSLQKDRLSLTAAAGLTLGLAVLCRSIVLLLPFVIFGAMLLRRQRRSVAHGLVLIVAVLLIVTPWSIQRSRVAGRFIPIQDQYAAAALFYVASRSDWDQNLVCWACVTEESKKLVAAATAGRSHEGEKENIKADKILFDKAMQQIGQDPLKYFLSRVRSFPHLFLTSYDSFTGTFESYGALLAQRAFVRLSEKIFLFLVFSLAPLLLGIAGLIFSRTSVSATLYGCVWLYLLIAHLPLWVEPRFWLPATPFLLLSAGLGASKLWERFSKGRRKKEKG
jgi:4-amino-4-deoxy-L-arabinose transferase-like glycosyltransferase